MDLRIYNARILNKDFEIIEGELWTNGDTISFVGNPDNSNINFSREINANGNLIMPGFKNAHSHSPMTFLRSFADDLPLYEWLTQKIFPMEAKLTAEHIYTLTKLAVLEYISGGITAAFDMYYKPEAIAEACIEYGFRMALCGAVNDFKESIPKLSDYYSYFNRLNPLISYELGFHAEYTTSLGIMKEIAALASDKKSPVYTHSSETEFEVKGCIERHGLTPIQLFDSLGLYDYGGGSFHSVFVNETDIEIMKNRGVFAISNPASNLKLASGIAPLKKLKKAGVKIALGTDGPASNNSLNMWKEMYLATALQKYAENDASCFPAEDVLKAALSGGAEAMRLSDCDCLEADKKADFIMVDLNMPNMRPLNNIVKNLIYAGSAANVKLTVINGKILYDNGKFYVNDDVEAVYSKAEKIINSMR